MKTRTRRNKEERNQERLTKRKKEILTSDSNENIFCITNTSGSLLVGKGNIGLLLILIEVHVVKMLHLKTGH